MDDPARWSEIRRLLDDLDERPEVERAAALDAIGDVALRREVAAILAHEADARDDGFLSVPASDLAADLFDHAGDPYLGRRIGPWQLEERLGEGGMGVVYRAARADADFRQEAALKLVGRGLAPRALLDRFRQERRILARLEHPHIARLLDGGLSDDGQPYFAMELVRAEPITAYADARNLSVSARLGLFLDVCEAVAYAHRSLVVHRDLKPSNVVVDDEAQGRPVVKLLDFGIAKLLTEANEDTTLLTRTGGGLMTPAYAAPEQVTGGPITTATDVYALGVLLYEVLSGQRPYDLVGATAAETERTITETSPRLPSEVAAAPRARQLRGNLDTIVLKALEKEPERRYDSAEALAADLRRHLDGFPITARRATAGYRVRSFVRRHPVASGLSALVVLALVLGMAGTTWQARIAAAERDRAQTEAETARQVTSLLTDLFVEADPYETRGAPLTVREMLERSPDEIAATLDGQPEVEAEVLLAIGQTFIHLGQYARADSLLRRSLQLYEQSAGPEDFRTAQARQTLGHARTYLGDNVAAEQLYREALRVYREVAPTAPEVPFTMRNVALALAGNGKPEEAEPLLRDALPLARTALGEDDPDLGVFYYGLGNVLRQLGRLDEAESFSRQSVAHYERTDPEGGVYATANLARLLHERGNDREAARLYRDAITTLLPRSDANDPIIADYRSRLAQSLLAVGQEGEAETLLLQALASLRPLGEGHPWTQATLVRLADLYERRGDAAHAARFGRRVAPDSER